MKLSTPLIIVLTTLFTLPARAAETASAETLFQKAQYTEALKCLAAAPKSAQSSKGNEAANAALRARILVALGKDAEALSEADKSLQLQNNNASALLAKAWALSALGRKDEFKQYAAKAAAADPQSAEAALALAKASPSAQTFQQLAKRIPPATPQLSVHDLLVVARAQILWKHPDEAVKTAKLVLAHDSKCFEPYVIMSSQENNLKQALTYALTATALQPDNYEAHRNAGVLFYRKNDFLRAFQEFNEAVPLAQSAARANCLFERAKSELELGDIDAATRDATKARELDSKTTDADFQKRMAMFKAAPVTALSRWKSDQQIAYLDKHMHSHAVKVLFSAATLALKNQNMEAATEYSNRAENLKKTADDYYECAMLDSSLESWAQANKNLERARAFGIKDPDITVLRANCFSKLGDNKRAEEFARAYIREKTKDRSETALYIVAAADKAAGQTGKVILDCEEWLKHDPASRPALTMKMLAESELKQLPAAIRDAEKLIKDDGTEVEPYQTLATIYRDTDRTHEALSAAERGLKAAPDDPTLLEIGAEMYLKEKQPAKAVQLWNKMVASSEGEQRAVALLRVADTLAQMGRLSQAEATYNELMEEAGENPLAFVGRGKLRLARGDAHAAELDFSHALKMLDAPEIRADRAECYLRMKQMEKAKADIASALHMDSKCAKALALQKQLKQ